MTFTTAAMVMREAGGPEVLEYCSLDLTWDPEGDEVLVRLVAATPVRSRLRLAGSTRPGESG